MARRPLIALADPEWVGHRETYFREFALSLHRLEAEVVALCPYPARLQEWGEATQPPLARLHARPLVEPRRFPVLRRLPQDPVTTQLRWRMLRTALATEETRLGRQVDLIFLPWLDSYLRASLHNRLTLGAQARSWAGLYFRPHHLVPPVGANGSASRFSALRNFSKGDALLRSKSCKAIATLDETLRPALHHASGKPILPFPDITDETAPHADTPFAKQIRAVAQGRKVIGLIGMEPRKGVITMLRAADLARKANHPWLFVLAGVDCLSLYTPEERQFVQEHINRCRQGDPQSNVLFPEKFAPIPDGAVFNGIMNTFDILFVAYHNFLGSSNVLTKAAVLQKLVVSTDLGCIAHRTKEFDLGLAIPQGDAQACCEAIERLTRGVRWNGEPLRPRYSDYHALHSRACLDQSMAELLSLANAPTPNALAA